ncbi:MAG: DUF1501 domain-containing protein [Planctomyces sp.]|nr:DUF1501 domain-containing protein [Planctomyces sp.]
MTRSRRDVLRVGLGGLAGLSLPELFRARAAAADAPVHQANTALILVWLPGGASHIETYDPKPDAPSEYRGPFQPIDSTAPGVRLCELLPRHAAIADRFTILRSVVHTGFCHQQGTQQLLTGHPVLQMKNQPDHPDLLSIAHRVRHDARRTLPNYVGLPPVNYSGSAYLGSGYDPFAVYGDPNSPSFAIPNLALPDVARAAQLQDRMSLRRQLDRLCRDVDRFGEMDALDQYEAQAWGLLTAVETRDAFDLAAESEAVRDRYGRNSWGQQCLLARRLVEAGVELVTVQFGGPLCGRVQNWDDHAVNHHVFDGMRYRCEFYDRAVAALVGEIYERGLDRRVMVVVTGEFGRTPKISYEASTGEGIASGPPGTQQPGRDHWPRATSMLFAGGGIRTGEVVGATDSRGEDAIDRIVGRGDFLATLYRHLGIDAESLSFEDHSGRPVPVLSDGHPIPELTAVA